KLSRLDSPVARKQVAQAVGALMGQGEVSYSLLSQTEFARDTAGSRLGQEIQKRVRKAPAPPPTLGNVLQGYVSSEYHDCLRALYATAEALPPFSQTRQSDVCRSVLRFLAEREGVSLPVESVLLALVALHALVTME